jgi:hypothetical protein
MTTFDQFAEDFWEVELPPLPIRPKTRKEAKRDFAYYAELSILDFQENIPRKFENGTDKECIGHAIYQFLKNKRLNRKGESNWPVVHISDTESKITLPTERKKQNSNHKNSESKKIIQQIMEDARNRARPEALMHLSTSAKNTESFTLNPKSIEIPEIVRSAKTPKERKPRKKETVPTLPLIADSAHENPKDSSNTPSVNSTALETLDEHTATSTPTKKQPKESPELEKPVVDFLRTFNRLKAKEMAQKARDLINNLAKKSKKKKQVSVSDTEMKKFELIQKCLKDFGRSMMS